jgi:uncharacterized lipoprotein YddW (UPF0748 family)
MLRSGLIIVISIWVTGYSMGCWISAIPGDDLVVQIPAVQREFRAAWVATVVNIDWPSAPGLPVDVQKNEALAILDTAVSLNLNAIILQIRPQCDAFYASELEPWSYYLTGVQGQAPEPFYDPLEFWIVEAHDRGLELHAWFNPYRAHHPKGGEISDKSVVRTHPGLVRKLDNGYYWLNPSDPGTREYSFNVVMDVLRRYDIDGIHFDDYFYPYGDGSFPDDDTWAAYQADGGKLSREDWRRASVNEFIEDLYTAIKKEKPRVKFGLSPFGIWRPGNPASIRGFDQYSILYADAKLWLNKGWIDYWSPQLYWPISRVPQSFPVLLGWWTRENRMERNIWPGLFTSRIADSAGALENINQIMTIRGFEPESPGHIHFSMSALLEDRGGIKTALKQGPYSQAALVPPSPWLDDEPPEKPVMTIETDSDSVVISWHHPSPGDVFHYVLYTRYGDDWRYDIFNAKTSWKKIPVYYMLIKKKREAEADTVRIDLSGFAVSAVDRTGNEGPAAEMPFRSEPPANITGIPTGDNK